jgi:undecaprenyl-diphosphatase
MDFSFIHIQAIILGLVEGLTEFLPISSSGHLVLVRELFGWEDQGLFFDMIVQFGTLFAIAVYFWPDWVAFYKSLFPGKTKVITQAVRDTRRLLGFILIANIPILIGALGLMSFVESEVRQTVYVASVMIAIGVLFLVIDKIGVPRRSLNKLTIYDIVSVGLAQAAAVIPGVSRSGATISAGIYQGLKREEAARLSYLIGAPAILMAGVYSIYQFIKNPSPNLDWLALGLAFIAAFVSGYLAIRFMLKYLQSHNLHSFAYYRIIVGTILLLIAIFNVPLPWLS